MGFLNLYVGGKSFVGFSMFNVKQTVQLKRFFLWNNLRDCETMLSKVWAINGQSIHRKLEQNGCRSVSGSSR